jgi:hypothetical protein
MKPNVQFSVVPDLFVKLFVPQHIRLKLFRGDSYSIVESQFPATGNRLYPWGFIGVEGFALDSENEK